MGLTSWKHSPEGRILKSDVSIAKNYLTNKELDFLQSIVNMYLDITENCAKRQIPMKMIFQHFLVFLEATVYNY